MNKDFIPKKIAEDNVEYVLLDNMFKAEEIVNYAVAHNFPIKFICTTYTNACEVLHKIQSKDYKLCFKEEKEYSDVFGLESTKIVVYCTL